MLTLKLNLTELTLFKAYITSTSFHNVFLLTRFNSNIFQWIAPITPEVVFPNSLKFFIHVHKDVHVLEALEAITAVSSTKKLLDGIRRAAA